MIIETLGPVFPRRVIRRCPAIILAANRTAKVPGRIIFLIVSMITINGIKAGGVPWGTKWANICVVLLIQPNIMKDSHKGRASAKVKIKCLVLVKIYGNKPSRLFHKIIENREIKIRVLPLIVLFLIRILNSLWRTRITLFHKNEYRDGISQYEVGINKIPKNVLSQLSDNLNIAVGSKEEKRFVIIFN